jgi:hypothetical protein
MCGLNDTIFFVMEALIDIMLLSAVGKEKIFFVSRVPPLL